MIFLSIRYLFAKPRQTLLTLLGIFFGTATYVAISSFFLGFRAYLIDQLVNNSAHVHIEAREDYLTERSLDHAFYGDSYRHIFWAVSPSGRKDNAIVENPQSWYLRLKADPRVEGYSPQLTASVIISQGKSQVPATLIGCDPLTQAKITTIGDYIIEGEWADLAVGGNRLVMGDELRKKLGVRLNQYVLVALANGNPTPFKVVAFFRTGTKQADVQAYSALGDVQRVNRTLNQINEIAVRLRDFSQSAAMAAAWSKISPEKIESWDQKNASFFFIFRVQDATRFTSIGGILIVAGFGIFNVLNMTVMQKKKDVAILRSMGYGTHDIVSLFFSQGLILGFSGATFGLLFAYSLCSYLRTLPYAGGPLGAGTGYMPMSMDPAIYIQAFMVGLLSSTVASIMPARSAGRLTPIQIIREGAE